MPLRRFQPRACLDTASTPQHTSACHAWATHPEDARDDVLGRQRPKVGPHAVHGERDWDTASCCSCGVGPLGVASSAPAATAGGAQRARCRPHEQHHLKKHGACHAAHNCLHEVAQIPLWGCGFRAFRPLSPALMWERTNAHRCFATPMARASNDGEPSCCRASMCASASNDVLPTRLAACRRQRGRVHPLMGCSSDCASSSALHRTTRTGTRVPPSTAIR